MQLKTKTLYSVNSTIVREQGGQRIAYGIDILSEDKKVCAIRDISSSKTFVEELADIFTRNDLSPIHIFDVLSDIL